MSNRRVNIGLLLYMFDVICLWWLGEYEFIIFLLIFECVRTVPRCTTAENFTLRPSTIWSRYDRSDTTTPTITSIPHRPCPNSQDRSQRQGSRPPEWPFPRGKKVPQNRRCIASYPPNTRRSSNLSRVFHRSVARKKHRNTSRKLSQRCRRKTLRQKFICRFFGR